MAKTLRLFVSAQVGIAIDASGRRVRLVAPRSNVHPHVPVLAWDTSTTTVVVNGILPPSAGIKFEAGIAGCGLPGVALNFLEPAANGRLSFAGAGQHDPGVLTLQSHCPSDLATRRGIAWIASVSRLLGRPVSLRPAWGSAPDPTNVSATLDLGDVEGDVSVFHLAACGNGPDPALYEIYGLDFHPVGKGGGLCVRHASADVVLIELELPPAGRAKIAAQSLAGPEQFSIEFALNAGSDHIDLHLANLPHPDPATCKDLIGSPLHHFDEFFDIADGSVPAKNKRPIPHVGRAISIFPNPATLPRVVTGVEVKSRIRGIHRPFCLLARYDL